jgi:quinol-cytochrome oxidoreductase complex cytochrome b subunit
LILNFHYYNAYLIFTLIMIHKLRVFIIGGYRRGKQALWQVGVGLAGFTFLLSTTGEALHWDEVGFAVPWHISEMLDVFGWTAFWNYTHAQLKDIAIATEKLSQLYGAHISLAAILLVLLIIVHYYLIKQKGISLPFWLRESGRTAPFTEHIREWMVVGGVILGVVLLIALVFPRDAGVPPQLLSPAQVKASFAAQGNAQYVAGKSELVLTDTVGIPGARSDPNTPTVPVANLNDYLSPLYQAGHGPGGLGYKPTYPISWTHGMNIFFAEVFGIDPDIWGTIVGMVLMLGALVIIPFVDSGAHEPGNRQEAFDLRKRGLAFAAMGLFWLIMIVGVISNMLAGPG